jgi:pyroglutamyl-peptidase
MTRVLITAFEPYDEFDANSSWLALVELTSDLPESPRVTTRLYPVDFQQVRERLARDLADDYDIALHLGQAPGSPLLRLEAIGLNVGGHSRQRPDQFLPLAHDGPVAYRSELPLATWSALLRRAGIPAQVSYYAGTYLCNATLYLTHYLSQKQSLRTQAAFLHLPLDPMQVLDRHVEVPSMPRVMVASAIRLILADLLAKKSVPPGDDEMA